MVNKYTTCRNLKIICSLPAQCVFVLSKKPIIFTHRTDQLVLLMDMDCDLLRESTEVLFKIERISILKLLVSN
jgi:hypothetical protein